MTALAAIVLAAGRSRRMGAFKPLLPFGERSVAQSCLVNLRSAGVTEIVVALGHRADEMREHLADWPVKFAFNTESESEMGVSLARGMEQLSGQAEAVFVMPIDQPAVPPSVFASLAKAWQAGRGRLLKPEHDGRGGHPVLISLAFREKLLHLDSERGLRGLFADHPDEVCRVAVDSPYIRRDVDTWEEYCALHEEVWGCPPPSNREAEKRI